MVCAKKKIPYETRELGRAGVKSDPLETRKSLKTEPFCLLF